MGNTVAPTITPITAGYLTRLEASGNTEALNLARDFRAGRISPDAFIAQASRFGTLTRSDSAGGLSRSARLFGGSPVSYDAEGIALVKSLAGADLSGRARDVDFRAVEGMMS